MSKVNTGHIVRLVLVVDLYKRPTSIPIITVVMLMWIILLTFASKVSNDLKNKTKSLSCTIHSKTKEDTTCPKEYEGTLRKHK